MGCCGTIGNLPFLHLTNRPVLSARTSRSTTRVFIPCFPCIADKKYSGRRTFGRRHYRLAASFRRRAVHSCLHFTKEENSQRYDVTVKHPVDTLQVDALLEGVQLHDEPARIAATGCEVRSEHLLRMTVTEGKYHLVKRMIAAAGNRVEGLNRIAIGGFPLPDSLPIGQWIWLEASDLARLARPQQ